MSKTDYKVNKCFQKVKKLKHLTYSDHSNPNSFIRGGSNDKNCLSLSDALREKKYLKRKLIK